MSEHLPFRFLGLDAGGTQTRWALADGAAQVLGEGHVAGLSGLQLHDPAGRAAVVAALSDIARAAGPVHGVVAGITGLDNAQAASMGQLLATTWELPAAAVHVMSDIELACRATFAPGEGVVVYAGTGSVAAFIDASGTLHRVGGRGAVIDDAGGGHWIACQALRHVWRSEDESPGAWRQSPLAQSLFQAVGGSDWAQTRNWVYGATRGELGLLALAAAAVADRDAAALGILQQAGQELARLAQALLRRHGPLPVALVGRVFDLHPCVARSLQALLPEGTSVSRQQRQAHHEAARLAAQFMAHAGAHDGTRADPVTP